MGERRKLYVFWTNGSILCNIKTAKAKKEIFNILKEELEKWKKGSEFSTWKVFKMNMVLHSDYTIEELFINRGIYYGDPTDYVFEDESGNFFDRMNAESFTIDELQSCYIYKKIKEYFAESWIEKTENTKYHCLKSEQNEIYFKRLNIPQILFEIKQ